MSQQANDGGPQDFARIVRASDGAQVLFYKSTDADGNPELRQVTDYEGIFAAYNLGFSDDDEGWGRMQKAFDRAGVEQADAMRKLIAKACEGKAA